MPEKRSTPSAGAGSVARRPIRVGLIGYGLGGRVFHAPLVAATAGMRLTAIVTRDPARRQQAHDDFPDATLFETADQLFANDLDLVVVASPNRFHALYALRALERGWHVVVDKPFAVTADDAQRVLDTAARRGLVVAPFQNRRWDGDFLTVRRLIGEGTLGEVLRFESRFERWRPTPRGGWRESGDPAEGGGLIYDLGAHVVDQALVLFGPAASVYAEADCRRPGVHAEDDAFIAIAHQSGVRSHLWVSAVVAQSGARFRLVGRRATYTMFGLDGQEDALRNGMRPGHPEWGKSPWPPGQLATSEESRRDVPTERGAYQRFYTLMAAAIRDGGPAPVDPATAVRGLEVLEAAHRSAREQRVIELAPVEQSMASTFQDGRAK